MKLIHRLGYYMGGFGIGLLLLFFFLGGKRASCEYGPNARTLKNIRSKPRTFTPQALLDAGKLKLDTHEVETALQSGDVLFSKSITDLDSCNIYQIKHKLSDTKEIIFKIENCSNAVQILEVAESN